MPSFSQKLSIQTESTPQLILSFNGINISPSKFIQKPVESNYSQRKNSVMTYWATLKTYLKGEKKAQRELP